MNSIDHPEGRAAFHTEGYARSEEIIGSSKTIFDPLVTTGMVLVEAAKRSASKSS